MTYLDFNLVKTCYMYFRPYLKQAASRI